MLQRFCAAMALASSMAVAAADGPLCPDHPIRFAFFEMGALYSRGVGIDKDLVEALQKRSGCTFSAAVQPRARTWLELERGNLDMTASALSTPAREKFTWFADYFVDRNSLLLRTELPATVLSLADLVADNRVRLGVVRGFVHGAGLDVLVAELRSQGRLEEVEDQETLYRMLAVRRFDAIFGYPYVYVQYLDQNQIGDKVRAVELTTLPTTRNYLALSRKAFTQSQAQRWQELLNTMRADGSLQAIFQKHLGSAAAHTMLKY
ncbi:ABC transporter substrate-binding protein [Rhodoferax sp.]|uniref:substrate-binding periplasmic protein n=1 Tax=Rhodoferax sp. TaxID=50421 RepID=UPI0025FB93E3|nr:ABC transporter substrate-binding protein [Rhodoferax sp.]